MQSFLNGIGFEAAFNPFYPPKTGQAVHTRKVTRDQFEALFPQGGTLLPRPGTVYILTD